jgi:F-type H+-transporting ATPase subunit b
MNINATLIGQSIVFFIFVWFCMKFVWPPIVAAMEERKKKIEDGLLAAQRGKAEQEEAQQKAQELIDQSKNQAAEIIANANKQASNTINDAKDIAITEAGKITAKAQSDIEQSTSKAAMELKDKLSGLVMQGVNKVLAKEVDANAHKDMIGKLAQAL